ncbi:LysR family transcriptional regulator [Variovorax sp. ZS18.2.2]|uniref:LysR family transcriptional regulator n=1 Tax=Variovorax sp. ZS18.2.2 TaxID=2971255 RepID=UPI002150F1AA|nr:LysR family transcriptional regulator [Variovorax sp. ZS18.2.2]MCR6477454.1 LysR family transcriptional regulator [Variovorax sp. ZS18.2.2]
MDIRWFQDFVTLAEVQNFTRAAEMRNVSQAAFSRRIQALEQWLGAKLIDRAAFPTRLTTAGERFRKVATGLLNQIADARAEIGDAPSRNHVRIASTYALVSTRLPQWWRQWSGEGAITCSLEVGNVHDTVSAFNAGSADILIGFHQAAHPIQLDMARFERHELGVEKVRPYLSRALAESGKLVLPGTAAKPVPLLMYSPSGYFARVVDSAIEQSSQPLFGYRAFEAEMTDVLGDLASQGMGIAWLPDSSFVSGRLAGLVPVGDGAWDVEVSIVAYRSRVQARAVVGQLWERICGAPDPGHAAEHTT